LTLPALMIAVVSPVAGGLIDRYGRLKLLWLSLVLYAFSGVAGYFLSNIYYILLSRAVLGISVGMSMTIVITLVADYFEGMERQKFVGLQVAFMSLAGIVFVGLGGILADLGWRYPFLLYLSAIVVLPFSMMFLYEPPATVKTGNANQNSKAPAFIWMLFVNTMLMWIFFFLIPTQMPFYFKEMGVEKNSLIGAAIAMSTACSAISSISYSRIKARLNYISIFSLGYVLMAAGFFCISVSGNYVLLTVGMMLSGLGMGMMIPNTNMWVMKVAPPEIRGKELGKLTTFWFLGQFLSPIIIFPVLRVFSLPAAFGMVGVFLLLTSAGFLVVYFRGSAKPSAN
jgi:MFS family permease